MTKGASIKWEQFTVNNKVWLDAKNILDPLNVRKLQPKRYGPFTVEKVLSPITYQLKLPNTWKIHPVFHADRLTRYVETPTYGKVTVAPPPETINGQEEYEVEAILKECTKGKVRQYLVKWKGYPLAERTWEPASHLTHAKEALAEFESKRDKRD